MEIKLKYSGDGYLMHAQNEEGATISIDAAKDIGGAGAGMRPMQLLLSALGGCSAIDILLILKKQNQTPSFFEVNIIGDRKKTGNYSLFRTIHINYIFSEDISPKKVNRAVRLSMDKYCSVAKTLEPTAKITYNIIIK